MSNDKLRKSTYFRNTAKTKAQYDCTTTYFSMLLNTNCLVSIYIIHTVIRFVPFHPTICKPYIQMAWSIWCALSSIYLSKSDIRFCQCNNIFFNTTINK